MSDYLHEMSSYWDGRFRAEGKIWGDTASKTAEIALRTFRANNVRTILIPGSGYGRHTAYFSAAGQQVDGIEISKEAIALARTHDTHSRFHHGSVLDMPFNSTLYDAIYAYNVLHLFREKERKLFVEKCRSQLRPDGLIFITVFSNEEKSFGKGTEIEPNTFESKPGRPVHYFTEQDLKSLFARFTILETGTIEDEESHGQEGPHTHRLRFLCARKPVQ